MADAAAAWRNCGNFGDIALRKPSGSGAGYQQSVSMRGNGRQENKGEAESGGHAPEGSDWGEEKLGRSGTILDSRNIR